MKRAVLLLMLVMMLMLAMLISPAAGQTAISPEVTPEFWPLTFDPATVTIDPDAFTLIFEASAGCRISRDWTTIALSGYGVFDLATGEKRFPMTGRALAFSAEQPFVLIQGEGVHNYETGDLVIPTTRTTGMFSPDGRFFVDYTTVYDLQTGEAVAELNRAGDGDRNFYGAYFDRNGEVLIYGAEKDGLTYQARVDTTTWQQINDPAPFLSRVESVVLPWAAVGETLIAINGDGVYEFATENKRFDIPAAGSIWFSYDDAFLVARTEEQVIIYDTATGNVTLHVEIAQASQLFPSFDNSKLVVTQYRQANTLHGIPNHEPVSVLVFDVKTGKLIGEFPGGRSVQLLSGDQLLAISGSGIHLLESGELLYPLHEQQYVMTSRDDRIYITGNATPEINIENPSFATTVVDRQTWEARFTVEGQLYMVSEDGRWLSTDGQYVYDGATGELALQTVKGDLVISADGRFLATTSRNHCHVYRVPEAQE
jgi:hypothetical protein